MSVFSRDRRLWLVAGAVVVGVAIGLTLSFTISAPRRAEAAILISAKQGPSAVEPFLPDLKTLATSSLLAGNVRSTLRMAESAESLRRRLHAEIRPHTQVLAISATGKDARSAQQLAQEAAVVFALLVDERFKTTTPPLHAAVLDPAHVLGGRNRHVLRNAVIGGVLGLVLGTAAAVLFGGPPAAPAQAAPEAVRDLMRRENLLEKRIKSVTARERELAARAALVTTKQRELQKRQAAEPVPVAAPAPPPPQEPEVPVESPPRPAEAAPRPASAGAGGWNMNDLDALVTANGESHPDQLEEWRTYLFFLRDHASIDGDLPAQFDSLIEDVFGAVLGPR